MSYGIFYSNRQFIREVKNLFRFNGDNLYVRGESSVDFSTNYQRGLQRRVMCRRRVTS